MLVKVLLLVFNRFINEVLKGFDADILFFVLTDFAKSLFYSHYNICLDFIFLYVLGNVEFSKNRGGRPDYSVQLLRPTKWGRSSWLRK
ncbi:MAG: hypothetical protein [Cressdnaviricota sp.]|nr:MAG: hypothetical protein [Cressdnaviricota sp.]